MLDALRTDLRLAVRTLRHAPGFSAVVVLTFALTLGANATVLSVLNAIVLRKAPVPRPDGIVSIAAVEPRTGQPGFVYEDTFRAFRSRQRAFSAVSMYWSAAFRVEAHGTPVESVVEGVSPGYFGLLGARPALGRLLRDGDDAGTPAVVISDRLWQRLFGSDPRAVGGTLKVDGHDMIVAGVMAPGFAGLQVDTGADTFVTPATFRGLAGGFADSNAPVRARYLIGRLSAGTTLSQAQAEVRGRWPAIQASTLPASLTAAARESARSQTPVVEDVSRGFSSLHTQYAESLVVLVALTAILLTTGCVSLTGLVLARAFGRQHQTAVRLALGASRPRLFQQMLLEGLLLAFAGMIWGLPAAWWSSRLLSSMLLVGRDIPLLRSMTPGAFVIFATSAVTIAAGLAIGLLPAWRSSRAGLDAALRPNRTIAVSLGRAGRIVLVAQVALAMVLLVAAGLFTGTLTHLRANDRAVRSSEVLFTKPALNPGDHTVLDRSYWEPLVRDLAQVPGGRAAALSSYFPAFLGYAGVLPKESFAPASVPAAVTAGLAEFVSPGFFDLFGIARLKGRDFTWDDDAGRPPVALLSRTAAAQLFPRGDALGQRVRIGAGRSSTAAVVVGIVADAPIGSIRDPHQPVVFRPLLQGGPRRQYPLVHVRVAGDLGSARAAYVRTVASHGHQYVRGVLTVDEWTDYALLEERLLSRLAACAAGLAVLLGCLGLYGLLAVAVNARVREIGVRMALGATREAVVAMIVRDGMTLAIAGVLVGVPAAIAAGRLVRARLYGVAPADPVVLAGAAAVFLGTGLIASLVPALRAARIDPMEALRQE